MPYSFNVMVVGAVFTSVFLCAWLPWLVLYANEDRQ